MLSEMVAELLNCMVAPNVAECSGNGLMSVICRFLEFLFLYWEKPIMINNLKLCLEYKQKMFCNNCQTIVLF